MPFLKDTYLGLPGRRVENIGTNVDEWNERTGEPSSTWDVCSREIKKLEANPHYYDDRLIPYGDKGEPSGEDGRWGDVEHPSYEEMDTQDRKCAICGVDLIDEW